MQAIVDDDSPDIGVVETGDIDCLEGLVCPEDVSAQPVNGHALTVVDAYNIDYFVS